jgi:hypothetical protein
MGISLEFVAAPHKQVFDAVMGLDLDMLDHLRIPGRYADFSFHLTPNDLNLLTDEACQMLNDEPVDFRESLDTYGWHIDEPDRGAYLVYRDWVELFSLMDDDQPDHLAGRWFARMGEKYDEPGMTVTPEVIDAVRALLSVCQYAIKSESDVVHYWFA